MIFLIIIIVLVLGTFLFMRGAQFGKKPAGSRLQAMQQSPNYRDGQFHNLNPTPQLTDGATTPVVMKAFFWDDKKRRVPASPLPSKKTNLHTLDANSNILVWFGHSSYFMQVDGKKILVDPVFSGNASPIKGSAKSFKGSDVYTTDDMPEIDYLFITHDHWDHLDYPTLLKLKPKVKKVITTLGTGSHLEHWGYAPAIITEGGWGDELIPEDGFKVNVMPARHFSGRSFTRNRALWASFVLTTPGMKIYIGGDSGYDTHFAETGAKYGPFDLAILEDGQYNKWWKYIHMLPEEVVQATVDLNARMLLPVHWGKFSLSLHDWDEPIKRVVKESGKRGVKLLHPMIGQAVDIKNPGVQEEWWEDV